MRDMILSIDVTKIRVINMIFYNMPFDQKYTRFRLSKYKLSDGRFYIIMRFLYVGLNFYWDYKPAKIS